MFNLYKVHVIPIPEFYPSFMCTDLTTESVRLSMTIA